MSDLIAKSLLFLSPSASYSSLASWLDNMVIFFCSGLPLRDVEGDMNNHLCKMHLL